MKLKGKKYIIAVSGGPDSMALLNKYKAFIVGACHVNYHKRTDSNHDQEIVSRFCLEHKIPLLIRNVNKKEYKSSTQHNFQALARQIRYDFFVECSKIFKCKNLLIAHNLNDFVETAIMQENRKSQNFYYGIRPEGKYKDLNVFRPLLLDFKKDLEKYCQINQIDYAIDSSNALDVYERNRVRKQLSKLSKKQILALYHKFDKRNKKLAKTEKTVSQQLSNWSKTNYQIKYFQKINPKLVDGVVYLYLKNNKIINVNYNKIKLVRDFIVSKKSNNSLRLENGIKLCKKDKRVKVIREK